MAIASMKKIRQADTAWRSTMDTLATAFRRYTGVSLMRPDDLIRTLLANYACAICGVAPAG